MIRKVLQSAMASIAAMSILAANPVTTWADHKHSDSDKIITTTPIKHVVVIFQENVSFDHYFATYPNATNPKGEPKFIASSHTPSVNNLLSGGLLDENPNSTQPFRLDRSQAVTCDQDHNYQDEQAAFNNGLMNLFPERVGSFSASCPDYGKQKGIVMGYYDGNTVTAIWNYAQHYAMSDNSYNTTFGPSTPGALNLIAGTTSNATMLALAADGKTAGNPKGNLANSMPTGAVIGDPRPGFDNCLTTPVVGTASKTRITVTGTNVGDLLNRKNVTWGWFQGGFKLTGTNADGTPACGAVSTGLASPAGTSDYIPHHQPFQYFESTANPNHLPASDPAVIGKTDQANHQYDLSDFFAALNEGRLPAVSFLKAKAAQDGHAGYSDPLDEQTFLVQTINAIQQSPEWKDTAIIIAYDDSDGWYDHQMDPVINQSNVQDDALTGPGVCGTTPAGAVPGRCGYGPRLPLLVISPFARHNYVDHSITDQASILRFIEDNWELGRIGGDSNDAKAGVLDNFFNFNQNDSHKLLLDPATGVVLPQHDWAD